MKKTLLLILLVAVVVAVVAILLDRSLFRGTSSDELEARYEALQEQLARSRQTRDSLDAVIRGQEAQLTALQETEGRLSDELAGLQNRVRAKDRQIANLRRNLTYVPSSDTLLRDLNRIARLLHAGAISAGGLPGQRADSTGPQDE